MISLMYMVLGAIIWAFAVGFREGYTWTKFRDRLPIMDYHAWRYMEQFGILFSVIGAYHVVSIWQAVLFYVGLNWLLTYTIYEPCLDYMVTGRWVWFKKSNPYNICGFKFNQGLIYQLSVTILGLILILKGITLCV